MRQKEHGTSYAVDGPVNAPDRSVWFIDHGGVDSALCHGSPATETMTTIKELDTVTLTQDIPTEGLESGDIGTVVMVYGQNEGYEVEFVGYDGHTIALLTLKPGQIRLLSRGDVPHVRRLAVA